MQPLEHFWFQPKNAWWWVGHIFGVIFPIIAIFLIGTPLIVIDVVSALTSIALFIVAGILGAFILSKSPYAPERGIVILGTAFLWGAFISIGMTFALGFAVGNLNTFTGNTIFVASFGGAIPEETLKLCCVLFVFNIARRYIYHPAQVMMVGMGVGLGFDIIENMSYGINLAMLDPNTDLQTVLNTWGLRLVVGPLAHMIWTGISAWGLGQFLLNKKVAALGWFCFSLMIHFLFNAQWPWDTLVYPEIAEYLVIATIMAFYLLSVGVLIWLWIKAKPSFGEAKAQRAAQVAAYQEQYKAYQMAINPLVAPNPTMPTA